jgi:ADP-heptose:LPS heptosyltransferase
MRTIITCPGIGDFIWVAQKLVNTKENFKIVMSEATPQRGHQLKELLPGLIAEHQYKGIIRYKDVALSNIQNKKKKWYQISEESFYLSANAHLESGKRIESFLPDLPTTFKLDYFTTTEDQDKAAQLLPAGKKYIGIYTSAYSNARHWNGWEAKEWMELIRKLKGKGVVFVVIGAEYDVQIPEEIIRAMKEEKIKYVTAVGEPLGVTLEMLKRLSYFIGFPSGLSILNETLGKDGLMFYAPHIKKIINTWADPERIKNHSIKECLFCEPDKVYEWLKNVYQIHDRI